MGTSKLHTLIIVIGGNYTYTMYIKKKKYIIYIYIYIYKYNVSCRVQSLKKKKKKKKNNKKIIINNINRKKKYFSIINPVSVFLSEALYYIVSKYIDCY